MTIHNIAAALKLLAHGKSTEAIAVSRRLVATTPASVTALVVLARALESQEQFRPAFDAWTRAAGLMPTSPLIQKGVRRTAAKMMGPIGMDFAEFTREENRLSAKAFTLTGAMEAARETPVPAPADRFSGPLVANATGADRTPDPGRPPAGDAASTATKPATAASTAATVQSGTPHIEELDQLIANLEGARIEPRPDAEAIEPAELDFDGGEMVSETLARIFTSQKQYTEAARVYEKLAERDPDRAEEFQSLALELRDRSAD